MCPRLPVPLNILGFQTKRKQRSSFPVLSSFLLWFQTKPPAEVIMPRVAMPKSLFNNSDHRFVLQGMNNKLAVLLLEIPELVLRPPY